MKRTYIFMMIMILLGGQLMAAPRKPAWVKQRPNNPDYYIGIAFSKKTGSTIDYMQDTRTRALRELSSEIEVTISSNSILQQLESNNDFYQSYESKINSSVLQTLEGYELETWEDKKEYWVMARLSKAKHKLQKEMKLDRAKMTASVHMEEAQKHLANQRPYAALESYFKAALSIKDHLEADLTHRSVNGTQNIGVAVQNGITTTLQNLTIEPEQKTYQIGRTGIANLKPTAQVNLNTPDGSFAAEGVPVTFKFIAGSGNLQEKGVSDHSGAVSTSINNIRTGLKNQQVQIELDIAPIEELFEQNEAIFKLFLGKTPLPRAVIKIELEKILASFSMQEIVVDDQKVCESLQRDIKTILSQNFFTFTQDEHQSKYAISINPTVTKGETKTGNGYTVYIVYGGLNMTIVDVSSGHEVFTHNISGVRGFQPGSYSHAITSACRTILTRFQEEVIPALEQLDL